MTGRLIELENVSLRRQAVTILDRLSLQIELGQHTVVLGPNGAGKTSFLKLLMRFFYPSVIAENSGRVSILGREQWNVWELRHRFSF
jgi:iron complex transport system ATP-binding protein